MPDALGRLASAALVLGLLALPPTASAQPEPPSEGVEQVRPAAIDFAPDNPHWHGTTGFVAALQRRGASVRASEVVDWDAARGAAMVLLGPSPGPREDALRAHLRAGGRVLLGVERSSAAETLRRWGLTLHDEANATLVHAGRRALPFALPVGEHRLTAGSPMVAANHPASLRGAGRPLLTFAGPDAGELMVELEVGPGRMLVLADPSVLVNNMLEFPGNARLADNVASYLCAGGEADDCRVVYVAGRWHQLVGLAERLRWKAQRARRALQEWDQLKLDPNRLWLLDVLLLGLCLVALVLVMPAPSSPPRRSCVPGGTRISGSPRRCWRRRRRRRCAPGWAQVTHRPAWLRACVATDHLPGVKPGWPGC